LRLFRKAGNRKMETLFKTEDLFLGKENERIINERDNKLVDRKDLPLFEFFDGYEACKVSDPRCVQFVLVMDFLTSNFRHSEERLTDIGDGLPQEEFLRAQRAYQDEFKKYASGWSEEVFRALDKRVGNNYAISILLPLIKS
jgi:hypothetical protein